MNKRAGIYVYLLLIFGVTANIAWSVGGMFHSPNSPSMQFPLLPIASVGIALVGTAIRNIQIGKNLSIAIFVTLISSALLIIPPTTLKFEENDIFGCVLFILSWSGAAAIAAILGRKRMFDIAAFIIGIRFIVVYFEVFGSLAATGFGLIISGGVILGIAYCWHNYRIKVLQVIKGTT